MVEYAQFQRRLTLQDPGTPSFDTGAADAWGALASASARITGQISALADREAEMQGERAGLLHGEEADVAGGVKPAAGSPSAATAGPPVKLSGTQTQRAQQAKAFFKGKGWSDVAAAAMVGQLQAESGLNPNAFNPNDPGGSFGLGQWNRERLTAMRAFARKSGRSDRDFMAQLEFVHHELTTSEGGVGNRLKGARSIEDAADIAIGYERPVGWSANNPRGGHNYSGRLSFARQVLGDQSVAVLPATARPASPASVSVEAGAPVVGAPAPAFTLTRRNTIRGRAFDQAAKQVYGNRLETEALTNLETIAAQTPDDPAAIAGAIETYRKSMIGEIPIELRAPFNNLVQRQQIGYVREASRAHLKKLNDEAEASFLETYQAKRTALVQLAGRVGIDAEGDAAIADEIESLSQVIEGNQALSPQDRVKLKGEIEQDVTASRVLSGFNARQTPEERQSYFEALQSAYADGEGPAGKMRPEAFAQISGQMQQLLARDETQRLKDVNAAERLLDGVSTRIKAGYAVPDAERARLKAQVGALGDPFLSAQYALIEGIAGWQATNRQQPPAVIAGQIFAQRQRMTKEGATPQDILVLDSMESLHKAAVEGLDKDPLGWAEQTGRIAIEPIDMSSMEAFERSLAGRAVDASAVSQTFGQPPQFFRPAERQALAKAISDNPDLLVDLAPALRRGLGDRDTPRALAELSKEAPVIAHAAGLAVATGDDAFLRETAQALKLRGVPDHQAITMPTGNRVPLQSLAALPQTEAAAIKTAELVFDLRARALGLSPEKEPDAAFRLWSQTVNEALGARTVNGEQVGGIGVVNGQQTLLPPNLSDTQVQQRLDAINPALLAKLPPIGSINGVAIGADQIANGSLIAVGPGQYRVALGNPQSDNPRYVMAKGGGFWILDITQIRPWQGALQPGVTSAADDPAIGLGLIQPMPWKDGE